MRITLRETQAGERVEIGGALPGAAPGWRLCSRVMSVRCGAGCGNQSAAQLVTHQQCLAVSAVPPSALDVLHSSDPQFTIEMAGGLTNIVVYRWDCNRAADGSLLSTHNARGIVRLHCWVVGLTVCKRRQAVRPAHGCSAGLSAGLLHSNPSYRVQASATPQQGRTVGDGLQGLQSVLRRVLPALAPAAAADAARHADEVRGRRRRHNGVQRRAALVALIQTEARLSFGSAFVLERRSPGCHHEGDWWQAPCQRPGRQGTESQVCEGLVRLPSVADTAGSPE